MSPRRRLLALHRFHHIFANLAYKTAWVSFTLEDMIQLSSGGFDSSVATAAPRIDAANPGAGEALGERVRGPIPKNKRNFTTIMGEWRALYGAVPPESSLLLRKYRQMYGVPAPGRRLLRSGRTTA